MSIAAPSFVSSAAIEIATSTVLLSSSNLSVSILTKVYYTKTRECG